MVSRITSPSSVSALRRSAACLTLLLVPFAVTAGVASAQCATQWVPSAFGSGLDGHVFDVVGMPNGEIIAGGAFSSAGGVPANRIARWDGTSWSSMALVTTYDVAAIDTLPSDDIIAAGG